MTGDSLLHKLQEKHSLSSDYSDKPETLAFAAQQGSLEAFESLVSMYEQRLFNFIRKKVGITEVAEDLLQEVFIKTYQNLNKYDPKRPFTTWVYAVAYNHTISYFRSSKPKINVDADYIDPEHPGQIVQQEESREQVWVIARRLPEGQFEALWLRYAENMSVSEVAKVMKKTQVHVKVILYRARKELMRMIDPDLINDLQKPSGGEHALSME